MRATLIIDGETRLDDELGEWHKHPPEMLADMVKPGAKPEPYLVSAGWVLADATMRGQSVRISVDTRPHGWTLTVDQP